MCQENFNLLGRCESRCVSFAATLAVSGMVLMDERTPPSGAYSEGVGRGRHRRVLVESTK
jgi:hypothetical protein